MLRGDNPPMVPVNPQKTRTGLNRVWHALGYSIEGLRAGWGETAFRQEAIAAVVLLPPTLIASIYGMNFQIMPELGWELGYPLAIGLMVLSGIAPYWYFKYRGWL